MFTVLKILAALGYTLSPIDLIPVVLPIIVWLDDIGVWALVLKLL